MAGFLTNRGAKLLGDGAIAWASATLKTMAMKSTFTAPSKDHNFVSEIAADECPNITGYTGGFGGSGRVSLASKTVTEDDTNDCVKYDAADVVRSALGAGATLGQYEAIIREVSTDANSEIIGYVQVDTIDRATNGGDVTIAWHADGLFKLST